MTWVGNLMRTDLKGWNKGVWDWGFQHCKYITRGKMVEADELVCRLKTAVFARSNGCKFAIDKFHLTMKASFHWATSPDSRDNWMHWWRKLCYFLCFGSKSNMAAFRGSSKWQKQQQSWERRCALNLIHARIPGMPVYHIKCIRCISEFL